MEPSPPAEVPELDRNWVRETAAKWIGKWLDYVAMMREATFHPRALAERWSTGAHARMNPLAFFGVSVGLIAAEIELLGKVGLDEGANESFWAHVQYAATPYAYYLLLALLCHGLALASGSRRKVLSTVALSLYAGGGPASLALAFIYLPIHTLVHRMSGHATPGWIFVLLVILTWTKVATFALPFSLMAGTLHRVPAWRLGVFLGVLVTAGALVLGHFRVFSLPASIPQPVLSTDGGRWHIRL